MRIKLETTITEAFVGLRLDQALAKLLPDYSRSRIASWIKSGEVLVDGQVKKPREPVLLGQQILIDATLPKDLSFEPQAIDLNIVFEDESVIIINKPAGLVVHPGAGNPDQTLLNALLHHCPELTTVPRAGIIHRIDKETTGLLVIAKTLPAHNTLVQQMQAREISREYICLVYGEMISGASIDNPIGRHPRQRTKMTVIETGKPAVTHYRIRQKYHGFTLLDVKLETGRTHQIRVHLSHVGYPIVGDPLYGSRPKLPTGLEAELREQIQAFPRQMLHATRLSLAHPLSGEWQSHEAPLPQDMASVIAQLPRTPDKLT